MKGRSLGLVLLLTVLLVMCAAVASAESTHEHRWSDWQTVTEPSCTQEGQQQRKCQDCGETETEAIPATGHKWDIGTEIELPTCEKDGRILFHCVYNEEHIWWDTMPAKGHQWDDGVVEKKPTCTERGIFRITCKNDETHTQYQFLAPAGHKYDIRVDEEPGCETAGLGVEVCTVCGEEGETIVLPAIGHHFVSKTQQEATQDRAGIRQFLCTVCGKAIEENFYARGVLYEGMIGQTQEVMNLQDLLLDLGYYDGAATGTFDASTRDALILFQTEAGLAAEGVCFQDTWDRLTMRWQEVLEVPLPQTRPGYVYVRIGGHQPPEADALQEEDCDYEELVLGDGRCVVQMCPFCGGVWAQFGDDRAPVRLAPRCSAWIDNGDGTHSRIVYAWQVNGEDTTETEPCASAVPDEETEKSICAACGAKLQVESSEP